MRGITYHPALIGALLALGCAVAGGYRIYEADIRVALAWVHLAAGGENTDRQD